MKMVMILHYSQGVNFGLRGNNFLVPAEENCSPQPFLATHTLSFTVALP